MILHIGPISQFTKFSLESFEGFSAGNNVFLATSKKGIGENKINYPKGCRVFDVSSRLGIFKYLKLIRYADAIIVHGMSLQGVISFIVGGRCVKVWSGWGYDYYGDLEDPGAGLLSDATVELVGATGVPECNKLSFFGNFKRSVYSCLRGVAAKKANYFSAPIPQDYLVFRKIFKRTSADYVQLNYGDVTSIFNNSFYLSGGNDILVGNSSSATNNHIDIFNILKGMDVKGRRIIVPLTYGDPIYREKLMRVGYNLFGNNFIPITDHLPLIDYLGLISSCNVAIMNHYRQQGIGNVGACFYAGMHVYMNKVNPLFDFFDQRGAVFYSVDDLGGGDLPEGLLSPVDVSINRDVLNGFWGDEVVKNNTKNLISKIYKN